MKKHFRKNYSMRLFSAVLLPLAQILQLAVSVSAEDLSYPGTTEMMTTPMTLDIDTSSVKLIVEEVYVAAGDSVLAGDSILKITEESYQEALAYYEASILRADRTLIDTQRSYEQGILDVRYEYESAKMEADQAEFIRDYQTEELTDCIEDHEDLIADLEERIAEIEAGEYGSDSSSGGGGASSGSGGSSAGGGSSKSDDSKSEDSKEEDSEDDREETDGKRPDGNDQTGEEGNRPDSNDQTGEDGNRPDGSDQTGEEGNRPDSSDQTGEDGNRPDGSDQTGEDGNRPGSGDQTGEDGNRPDGSDQTGEDGNRPGSGDSGDGSGELPGGNAPETGKDDTSAGNDSEITQIEERIAELKGEISVYTENCSAILSQIISEIDAASVAEVTENSGEQEQNSSAQETTVPAESQEIKVLEDKLQTSIDGNTVIKGHVDKVLAIVNEKLALITTVAQASGIDYQNYLNVLNQCSELINADLVLQQEVKIALASLSPNDPSADEVIPDGSDAVEAAGIDQKSMLSLLTQFSDSGEELRSLYEELQVLEEKSVAYYQEENSDLKDRISELSQSSGETEIPESRPDEAENRPNNTESGPEGTESRPDNTESRPDGTENRPGGTGSGSIPDFSESGENSADGSMSGGGFSGGSFSGGSFSGGSFSGGSFSGGSMSGGSFSGGSMSGGSFSGESVSGGSGMTMQSLNLTESDISLLGSEYDISQYESILEREPSDSDEAEEYLDTLRSALKTVKAQYSEITRNRPACELKIQYLYDSSILQGKLAEIVYEQDLQEWKETLSDAIDAKETLIEKKANLEKLAGGIITAEETGLIASVGYEAEDRLSAASQVISYYDTDEITITIAVPQEQICGISVGDRVSVRLSDLFDAEGTISEKAASVQDGNSRTDINYEIKVSLGNEDGRFSSGMAADVTFDLKQEENNE